MNLKKFLFILLAFVLLAACNSKKEGGKFTVSGKLENLKAENITLDQLSFESEPAQTLDTSKVSADGSFSLEATGNGEEAVYRLMIDGSEAKQWIFINDHKDLKVTLNGNDLLSSKPEGSESTTELYTFLDEYRVKDSLLMLDLMKLDELQKKTSRNASDDSLASALVNGRQAKINDLNTAVKNFIKNAKSPAAVYFTVAALAPRSVEPVELLTLVKDASAKHKGNKKLADLSTFLETQINAMTGGSGESYPLMNKPAPELEMQTPEGKKMKISDFKGKYVLVDFWASWCGPCRAENPNVVAAFNKHKNKNFTILGVSLDKDKSAWLQAIKEDNLAWSHMSDLKFWESAAVPTYGFQGIPFNVLIDPTGKIIANNLRGSELDAKLAELVK